MTHKILHDQFPVSIPGSVHDLQDYQLGSIGRWQEPAFQISEPGLRVTHLLSLREMLHRWWPNMYRFEAIVCHNIFNWWPVMGFMAAVIPNASHFHHADDSNHSLNAMARLYITFWQPTLNCTSTDIRFVICKSLVLDPYYAKFPYDFMVKFPKKLDLFKGMAPNSVLLTFEDDHHLQ